MPENRRTIAGIVVVGLLSLCFLCSTITTWVGLTTGMLETQYGATMAQVVRIVFVIIILAAIGFSISFVGMVMGKPWGAVWARRICVVLMITGFPIGTLVFGIARSLIKPNEGPRNSSDS